MANKFNIHDWQAKQRLAEMHSIDFDSPQYDGPGGEGKMAKGDVIELAKDASDVVGMIGPNTNLPEWVEAKITKAAEYMNTVKDYLSNYDASRGLEEDEDLEEISTTGTGASFSPGAGEAYATPMAFGDDKGRKMKVYKSLGYKRIKEQEIKLTGDAEKIKNHPLLSRVNTRQEWEEVMQSILDLSVNIPQVTVSVIKEFLLNAIKRVKDIKNPEKK
tara:strand:+ start:150 stop:800 length:651 start_codon:yes stop_codon:yes gene_type:complete